MPERLVSVGGREYEIACQPGEEEYLDSAAQMLDAEAQALAGQGVRLTESRLLLISGLMLADKTAGAEDQLRAAQERIAELEAALHEAETRPAPPPERVEVPVIPNAVLETLSELAARAEAMADEADRRAEPDT